MDEVARLKKLVKEAILVGRSYGSAESCGKSSPGLRDVNDWLISEGIEPFGDVAKQRAKATPAPETNAEPSELEDALVNYLESVKGPHTQEYWDRVNLQLAKQLTDIESTNPVPPSKHIVSMSELQEIVKTKWIRSVKRDKVNKHHDMPKFNTTLTWQDGGWYFEWGGFLLSVYHAEYADTYDAVNWTKIDLRLTNYFKNVLNKIQFP